MKEKIKKGKRLEKQKGSLIKCLLEEINNTVRQF